MINDSLRLIELYRIYQDVVRKNDAAEMDKLLEDDFVLATGSFRVLNKGICSMKRARGRVNCERQESYEQSVRISGGAAVITAKLRAKGEEKGSPSECKHFFSDTYVRRDGDWSYFFGKASTGQPPSPM